MADFNSNTIGQYQIIEQIGSGGMANVYRAVQANMGREVAIKILPGHFMQDSTFLKRFYREVRIIAQLEHPRILPVHDFGEHEGRPYIVMRYLTGGSLSDYIRRYSQGLPLDDVRQFTGQIAEGLDFAHQRGVIHRDLKPSNVLLDDMNNVYLADFGIAKAVEATAQLTGSGLVGTPAYMAPEMVDRGGATHLVDVYALGVVLFQMLSGKQPYQADTPMGTALAHIAKPIPDIRALRPDLPPTIQDVINDALAKDPAERYQSCRELAAGLETSLDALEEAPEISPVSQPEPEQTPTVPAAPADALTMDVPPEPEYKPAIQPGEVIEEAHPVRQPAETVRDRTAPGTSPTQERKRSRFPVWLLGVLAVVGLVILALIFWPHEQPVPAAIEEPTISEAEARIAELEAQLTEFQEGAASEEALAALEAELEAARAVLEGDTVTAEPAAAEEEVIPYRRSETLFTSGTQWGPPSSWNPFNTWGNATGTFGLVYESLFLYDPLTDQYIPWLAESGEWTSDTVYELTVREGISWSDGEPFTAADVKYTFEMAQDAPVNISPVWNFLKSIDRLDDYTLVFNFSDPLYQQWANYLYTTPIVPQHLWESKGVEEITSGTNENPVGTGPYLYESHEEDRMVWVKNNNWWGADLLGLDPKPRRIIDIVNSSNDEALSNLLEGELDLSNNYLVDIPAYIDQGKVQTYYPGPPYMLSANTAWLLMNTTTAPMDDPAFRRAVAVAIDTDQIVEEVYGNTVQAANPTGLLPVWDQYVDQDVVDELGFSYDSDEALWILGGAGYVDLDGDGYVEAPDGSTIALSVIVPNGWTDWMDAIEIISANCQAVGINLKAAFPDYYAYADAYVSGTFEMVIANEPQISNTPWTYYDWMFQNPIEDIATLQNGNYGRYDNQEAFDLVDQLAQIPIDDLNGMREIMSRLQTISLTDLPLIPLWYNGIWAQYNDTVWTNWPGSETGANHYLPSSWRGYWNMTGILMLTELEPATQ